MIDKNAPIYCLTRRQLADLLCGTLESFQVYLDYGGYSLHTTAQAAESAVSIRIQSLDSERTAYEERAVERCEMQLAPQAALALLRWQLGELG